MNHIEGTFKSIRNLNVYYQAWLPDGEIKAVIFLVHGLGEHSGRYSNLLNRMIPQGYAVYGIDHIGHGKSEGDREMAETFSDYTDTLKTYYKMVKEWQPDKPIFIYGHSMGGLITCNYLIDNPKDFNGAVLSAPALKAGDDVSPVTIFIGKILSRIAPKIGVIGLDTDGISRDPEVVEAYINDPLVFSGKTPARLAAEILKAIQSVERDAGSIRLPLLVLQGSGDTIVHPGGAEMIHTRAGSADKTLKIYEGLYHEVHNEPEKNEVFDDVENWLSAHV